MTLREEDEQYQTILMSDDEFPMEDNLEENVPKKDREAPIEGSQDETRNHT